MWCDIKFNSSNTNGPVLPAPLLVLILPCFQMNDISHLQMVSTGNVTFTYVCPVVRKAASTALVPMHNCQSCPEKLTFMGRSQIIPSVLIDKIKNVLVLIGLGIPLLSLCVLSRTNSICSRVLLLFFTQVLNSISSR